MSRKCHSLNLVGAISSLLLLAGQGVYPNPSISAEQVVTQQVNTQLSQNQLKQVAQSITVKVVSGENQGSGILIKKQGQIYTVLTNQHILETGKSISIQTPDSKTYVAELIKEVDFSDNDLVLLQFRAAQNYSIATLGNLATVAVNDPVFAAGFSFEANSSQPNGFAFTTGQVLYVPEQAFKEGYQLGYNNEIEKGMSGGPILNQRGQVIGINGIHAYPLWGNPYVYQDGSRPTEAERDLMSRYSWGIPIQTFAKLAPQYTTAEALPVANVPSGETLPPIANEVNNIAQAITVLIKWPNQNRFGSGVIVAKQGNTYYVLTANHVVERKTLEETNFEVVTPDNQRYSVVVNESNVKTMPGADLAVVQFVSNQSYRVATLANYDLKTEKGFVFTSGWSKSGNGEFSRLFSAGSVFNKETGILQGKDSLSLSYGYELVYTNITAAGVSGGAVLDSRGRVIGIHGRVDGEEVVDEAATGKRPIQLGYSLGIPVRTFVNLATRVGIEPGWLKIESSVPPSLTAQETNSILESVIKKVEPPNNSQDPTDWLNYGNQLWRLGRNESALSAFERATQLQPHFYQAWYAKGLTLYQLDKYPEAIAAFDKAIRESKEPFAAAWRWRGQVLFFALKHYQEALAAFEQAVAIDPKNFSFYALKGQTLDKLKRYQEAITAYTKTIEINPHPWSYNNRAILRNDLGDKQGALSDYNKAIELKPDDAITYNNRGLVRNALRDRQGALADFTKAVELKPDFANAYNNRGIIRSALGDKQGALADYNKAIELEPDDAITYNNRGIIRNALRDRQGALADFTKAVELKPDLVDAYYNRSTIRDDLGDKQGAIADFTKFIELKPDFAEAYNNRGIIRKDLGDKQGAIADFTKVIELKPDLADAYYNRGIIHSALGDKQGAIADFTKFIELEFELEPNYAIAYYNRGIIRKDLGDKQGAITDFTKVIELKPNYVDAYYNRGAIRDDLGDKQGAIADFTKTIELKPGFTEAYTFRGIIRNDLGDKQGAIADFTKTIELKPDFAEIYNLRGAIRDDLGDQQGAIADYNKAIELKPDFAEPYFNRGNIRYQQGDSQGALTDYNQAVKNNAKFWPAINNIGLIKYEMGDTAAAIQQWQTAINIDTQAAEPQLAIAVALYAQGNREQALTMAQTALKIDKRYADLNFLKQSLWGNKLLADAKVLLETPTMQSFLSQAQTHSN